MLPILDSGQASVWQGHKGVRDLSRRLKMAVPQGRKERYE